jgi:hypothetical protein
VHPNYQPIFAATEPIRQLQPFLTMPADPNNPKFPSFDELPYRKGDPGKACWGFWPENDQFGMLNLLTPERILEAKKEISTGQVASLKYFPQSMSLQSLSSHNYPSRRMKSFW